jgi:hypothetical protein
LRSRFHNSAIEPETVFETKNLYQLSDKFVITADGKLLWRLYRYKPRLYRYQADRDLAPASQLRTLPRPVLTATFCFRNKTAHWT